MTPDMALPVAHSAIAMGFASTRDRSVALFLCVLSFCPDFDFFFVWFLGMPLEAFHRTFSHSLLPVAVATGLFVWFRPARLSAVSGTLFFAVLGSHAVLDMLCTADRLDHGVMLFWPVSDLRLGWPVLVPLYSYFGESPFSPGGFLRFTALEVLLAPLLWLTARVVWRGFALVERLLWKPEAQTGSNSLKELLDSSD
jgi:membrane-bound metal-dependent hydrolase YbcI (DUF457 family)